jgi:hypothetical protein
MLRTVASSAALVVLLGFAPSTLAGCKSAAATLPNPLCDGGTGCSVAPGDDGGGITLDSGSPYVRPEAGAPCVTSDDCALGLDCAYAIADGCSATGTCIFTLGTEDGGSNCTTTTTCGCDGLTHRFLCYPGGYALTPTEATGECDAGGADGGATEDAGTGDGSAEDAGD